MSSKAAIQLAGNASSIVQAWLDLKRQISSNSTILFDSTSGDLINTTTIGDCAGHDGTGTHRAI
jgi:site-specific recombinase XerC